MSSEAAQKAYPDKLPMTETNRHRAAFDRGAVEALRQAAASLRGGVHGDANDRFILTSGDRGVRVLSEWEYNRGGSGRSLVDWLDGRADEWQVEK